MLLPLPRVGASNEKALVCAALFCGRRCARGAQPDQLLSLTQGREAELFERSIDLLVSRLRQRLRDDAREPRYIKTVRSEGYVLASSVEAKD